MAGIFAALPAGRKAERSTVINDKQTAAKMACHEIKINILVTLFVQL
jgi:hypothetical protein